MIIDFEMKPLKSGNAEAEAAPTMQKAAVQGIVFTRPPSSDPLQVPVRKSTAPMLINSSALYKICTKA